MSFQQITKHPSIYMLRINYIQHEMFVNFLSLLLSDINYYFVNFSSDVLCEVPALKTLKKFQVLRLM
jgi:hypothetical protein